MANNNLVRKKMAELQAQTQSEKQWWERRRAGIQSDFMRELDENTRTPASTGAKTSDDDAVLVEGGGPGGQQGGGKKKKAKK